MTHKGHFQPRPFWDSVILWLLSHSLSLCKHRGFPKCGQETNSFAQVLYTCLSLEKHAFSPLHLMSFNLIWSPDFNFLPLFLTWSSLLLESFQLCGRLFPKWLNSYLYQQFGVQTLLHTAQYLKADCQQVCLKCNELIWKLLYCKTISCTQKAD